MRFAGQPASQLGRIQTNRTCCSFQLADGHHLVVKWRQTGRLLALQTGGRLCDSTGHTLASLARYRQRIKRCGPSVRPCGERSSTFAPPFCYLHLASSVCVCITPMQTDRRTVGEAGIVFMQLSQIHGHPKVHLSLSLSLSVTLRLAARRGHLRE